MDFSKLVNKDFLTEVPAAPMKSAIFLLVALFLIFACGIVWSIFIEKTTYPKFHKKFLRWCTDVLIYPPFLVAILVLSRMSGLGSLSKRIFLLIVVAIWLIWLIFLIYYRLFVVSRMWRKYNYHKRQEGYLKNGKGS